MNLKRFTGRTSRDALALVKQAFGNDAVVMSTRPCEEGVEVLAMAPESLKTLETVQAPRAAAARPSVFGGMGEPRRAERSAARAADRPARASLDAAAHAGPVEQDVTQLAMSTLSFQDYVRERMLKRRRQELGGGPAAPVADEPVAARAPTPAAAAPRAPAPAAPMHASLFATRAPEPTPAEALREAMEESISAATLPAVPRRISADVAHEDALDMQREQQEMMRELRSMRGLIEQRFGALAFMEKLQREPRQALLTHRLLEAGFSPVLVRKLLEGLPAEGDELGWATQVLQRNLPTGESDAALEDVGGVYAMVGPTGVGKTTSTAKLAAAFAARHGAGNLGLITLDAYRVAAHEQLRAYGRILGVPVHTAHDRASLDDLLELLSGKRMVLIDTAGMAQRDTRTKELLDMLSHRSVNRLLVVNAASQGETVDDVLSAYRANTCRGVVLSKIDEAMKLGPALDAIIRHKSKVVAVANGQRVPEDWHRLSAQALIQRALRAGGSSAWKLDGADVNLVFSAQPGVGAALA